MKNSFLYVLFAIFAVPPLAVADYRYKPTPDDEIRLSELRGSYLSLYSFIQGNRRFDCQVWRYGKSKHWSPSEAGGYINPFAIKYTIETGNALLAVAQVDFEVRNEVRRSKDEVLKKLIQEDQYEIYCVLKD